MSAYYEPPANATRPTEVIVDNGTVATSPTALGFIRIFRDVVFLDYGPTPSAYRRVASRLNDEVYIPAAAYYRPARPRKGAYVALIPPPHLVPRPSLEASPKSAPRVVRQAGWRLAVHTRHVTTSL